MRHINNEAKALLFGNSLPWVDGFGLKPVGGNAYDALWYGHDGHKFVPEMSGETMDSP